MRFADDAFTSSFITTIGIDFKIVTVTLGGKRIKFVLSHRYTQTETFVFDLVGFRSGTLQDKSGFEPVSASHYRVKHHVRSSHSHHGVLPWCNGYHACV